MPSWWETKTPESPDWWLTKTGESPDWWRKADAIANGPGTIDLASRQRFLDLTNTYRGSELDSVNVIDSDETYGDYRAPRAGSVLGFDGSSSSASVADFINFGSTFTLCCRVRLSASSNNGLVSQYTTTGNQRSIRWIVDSTGRQRMYLSSDGINGTSYQQSGGATHSTGVVYHMTVRFDGSDLDFFTDGAQNGTTLSPSQSSVFNSTGSVRVGAGFFTGSLNEILDGQIWDVRVFDSALTDGEIETLAGEWSRHGDEIAHWPGCEESGATGYDVSGNGHDLTLANVTHTEQSAAKVSVVNSEGYKLSGSVVIPSLDGVDAADGSTLDFTGRCPFPAISKVTAVINDGGSTYLAAAHLDGTETIASWQGSTTEPTTSSGRIDWDSGETLAEVVLSDGTHYILQAQSRTVYDVSGGGNNATVTGGSSIYGTLEGAKDWNILHGGRLVSGVMIPGLASDNGNAANGLPLTHAAGKHGNPDSEINTNYWGAPELHAINAETDLEPGDARSTTAPNDTKFSRVNTDEVGGNAGDDRFLAYLEALV